jgi:FkbM family methyltransferase
VIDKLFMVVITTSNEIIPGELFNRLHECGDACSVSSEEALGRVRQLALIYSTVVLVGANTGQLAEALNISGILPVLVDSSKTSLLDSDHIVVVSKIDDLECLFREPIPNNLLGLLRIDFDAETVRLTSIRTGVFSKLATPGGVYIFGAGVVGRQTMQECQRNNILVRGFVDNNPNRRGEEAFGVPILSPADLNPARDVVIVSVGKHAEAIAGQLRGLGVKHIVNLSQFFYAVDSADQPERDYFADLSANRMKWIALALILGDRRSRQVLDAVVCHRLGLDIAPLAAICDSDIPQWFDPQFLAPDEEAVFVDGGAYDGDTAEAFRQINGPALRIHAFELDPDIASRAAIRLKKYPEAVVHPSGLSDRRTKLAFTRTGITDGKLTETGESSVEVTAIDDVVTEEVTFIKLDIEGYEKEAIVGAERQIRNNLPLIALAVYHKASDPWSLPLQISALNSSYKFYLRHYTQVAFETVVYAVPVHSLATE